MAGVLGDPKPPLKRLRLSKVKDELKRVMNYDHILRVSTDNELTRGKVSTIISDHNFYQIVNGQVTYILNNEANYAPFLYLLNSVRSRGVMYVDIMWDVSASLGPSQEPWNVGRDIILDFEFLTKVIRTLSAVSITLLSEDERSVINEMRGDGTVVIPEDIPDDISSIIVRYKAESIFEEQYPYLKGEDMDKISDFLINLIDREYTTPSLATAGGPGAFHPLITPELSGGILNSISIADKDVTYYALVNREEMQFETNNGDDYGILGLAELINEFGILHVEISWEIPDGVVIFEGRNPPDSGIEEVDILEEERFLHITFLPEFLLEGG
jgi:hypothetical protein